ncbi:glycosyltransferase family 2 protein [Chryseobacterium taiwanense]|uniref:Glycosyltransferase 2-like domain-containing protein n=1 Tax=Chryseobacterium taiwanense TaxID=363331 RepID=A0A0B4CTH4_9FLAO|nr:glycosyltransferase family 2 protein [Chryseobacterium taiwanense]KIC64539.1 hypothetical protein RM51_03070 [Chryseobacterium taiwanense]
MKISVALCTYNGEKYIKEQLDSILNQTTKVDEIVICDDKSTDTTMDILRLYENKYPDIFRVYTNEETLKSVKNFEKAISLCTGEITFLSDQDDFWYPEKVSVMINHFLEQPEMMAFCSNGFLMNENSEIIIDHFTKWDVFEKYSAKKPHLDTFNFLTQKGNFSTGATMAVKTDFAKSTFPIPEVQDFHHDEWITLLATVEGKMGFINQKLINYRVHSTQQVGGIAFHKDSKYFKQIFDYFSFNDQNDFKSIKSRIKAQVEWHNKFLINFKSNSTQYQLLKNKFDIELKKNNTLLNQNFPLKSFVVQNIDKLLNKRQLKK